MTDNASAPAGYYDDGSGRDRWWDGSEWGPFADELVAEPAAASAPAGFYDDGTGRMRWFDGTEWGAYQDDVAEAVDVATPVTQTFAPAEEEAPVIIRRTRRAPFNPPSPDGGDSGITVSRSWGLGLRAAQAKKDSGLTRNRKVAGELPAWSPLPPGELAVDRKAGKSS